jgi:outer membrane PBP1 activator LpoA protein
MSAKGKFMPFRKINSCLLAAAMMAALLPTGCRVVNQPPANNETVYYQKWETETHRQHVDQNQRSKDEQKEYSDWRQKQDDHH